MGERLTEAQRRMLLLMGHRAGFAGDYYVFPYEKRTARVLIRKGLAEYCRQKPWCRITSAGRAALAASKEKP